MRDIGEPGPNRGNGLWEPGSKESWPTEGTTGQSELLVQLFCFLTVVVFMWIYTCDAVA